MAKTVYVDENLCIGCGLCANELPAVFEMKADISIVKDPAGASEDEIENIMSLCPVACILWK